jgi:hypothetical protein
VHVIGITPEITRDRAASSQLDPGTRWRFNTWNNHTSAYLDLFVESFNAYARRDSDTDLIGIHVLVHLKGPDLTDALRLCDSIERDLLTRPQSWRIYLGTQQHPGQVERRIEPLIFRRRALDCVSRLRALICDAVGQSKAVVLGSGAPYRALCGITDGEYYS